RVAAMLERERIVDFGGADVIEAESFHPRHRQILRHGRDLMCRERRALGKEFVQEALQVVIVAVGEQSAALEELRRDEPGLPTRRRGPSRLGLVAVGRRGAPAAGGGDLTRPPAARERRGRGPAPLLWVFFPPPQTHQSLGVPRGRRGDAPPPPP